MRPVVLSRVKPAKSSSTPTSSRECRSRNFRYASLKCRRFPRRRSISRRDTSTATGRPRRVSSTSIPDSASSTRLGSRDLASAIEYRRDIPLNVHHDVHNRNFLSDRFGQSIGHNRQVPSQCVSHRRGLAKGSDTVSKANGNGSRPPVDDIPGLTNPGGANAVPPMRPVSRSMNDPTLISCDYSPHPFSVVGRRARE